jgi:hypothetical protein
MPAILAQILPFLLMSLGGVGVDAAVSGLGRKLLGRGASTVSKGLVDRLEKSALQKGLSTVGEQLPGFLGRRANVGSIAGGLGSAGSHLGHMLLGMSPFVAYEAMQSRGEDRNADGLEMYQGQPNPGTMENADAMAQVDQHTQMAQLEQALKEYIAGQREAQSRLGGIY